MIPIDPAIKPYLKAQMLQQSNDNTLGCIKTEYNIHALANQSLISSDMKYAYDTWLSLQEKIR